LKLTSTDSRLIESFRKGDAAAFDALVERHKQRVFNLLYRMTGDRERAEDITVDVFLETYFSLPGFKQKAKFTTWLHRLAVNVCLEHLRRKKAKRQLEETSLEEGEAKAVSSPAELVITKELAERIIGAIQVLPETHRAAITMFYLEGRSCAEIAEILDIPRNTVKTRIFYATRVLRDRLQDEGIISSSLAGE